MGRRQARRAAAQLIYEKMMGGEGGAATETSLLELGEDAEELAFVREAVEGVFANESELDEIISRYLVGWTMERLARVELAILRLACFEITHKPEIPIGVSIEEAAELTRRFSEPKSVAFVTGILSSVSREFEHTKQETNRDE